MCVLKYIVNIVFIIECFVKCSPDAREEQVIENLYYASFEEMIKKLDSNRCENRIISPNSDAVWTASYLRVEWWICENFHSPEKRFTVQLNGQEFWRGEAGPGHVTVYGVTDGIHSVQVSELDFGESKNSTVAAVRFVVKRGVSLLGSMAEKVAQMENENQEEEMKAAEQIDLQESSEEIDSTDDITFVTAALDIGRRHGNISFEDDYIGNLRHILSLGVPLVIHLQSKHAPLIEPYLHARSIIRIKVQAPQDPQPLRTVQKLEPPRRRL